MFKFNLKSFCCCISLFLIAFFLFVSKADAQTKICDSLNSEKKVLATNILKSQHLYNCCDDTILNCLNQKPKCKLSERLANDICKRVNKNQPRPEIEQQLAFRARSMMSFGAPAIISLKNIPYAGNMDAPVKLVIYACTRCPFCGKITSPLYNQVISGSLKGKVQLFFKPFPLRSHEGSAEGGKGIIAAHKLNKFWPFLLKLYNNFDSFSESKMEEWAKEEGMDIAEFKKIYSAKETKDMLVESKREGIRNNVTATPTIYINGRNYLGSLDIETLTDVLLEEYDMIKNDLYVK